MSEQMKTFEFTRWIGRRERVEAERIDFTAGGGLAFLDGTSIVLAVRAGDWNDVREITEPPVTTS